VRVGLGLLGFLIRPERVGLGLVGLLPRLQCEPPGHSGPEQQGRQKRGGARVQRAADWALNGSARDVLNSLAARGPTPEEAAILAEECGRLLALLDDDLRRVALWKMEGFSNAEIATRLGRSESTVERKLKLIRTCWEL
jgi:DNA-directed RNA polymerase specialized sigma24 family protein